MPRFWAGCANGQGGEPEFLTGDILALRLQTELEIIIFMLNNHESHPIRTALSANDDGIHHPAIPNEEEGTIRPRFESNHY